MLLHIFNIGNGFIVYKLLISLLLFGSLVVSPLLTGSEAAPQGRQVLLSVSPEGEHEVMLSAAIRINARSETVWSVLVDCEQALEYVPDIRECRVMESGVDDNDVPFDITMHRLKPYFFLPSVKSIFHASYQKPERIEFRKAGGDLESFEGEWRFEQEGEQQMVLHYQAIVNLSKHLNQRSEIRTLRKDIPDMLEKLRELVELGLEQSSDDSQVD